MSTDISPTTQSFPLTDPSCSPTVPAARPLSSDSGSPSLSGSHCLHTARRDAYVPDATRTFRSFERRILLESAPKPPIIRQPNHSPSFCRTYVYTTHRYLRRDMQPQPSASQGRHHTRPPGDRQSDSRPGKSTSALHSLFDIPPAKHSSCPFITTTCLSLDNRLFTPIHQRPPLHVFSPHIYLHDSTGPPSFHALLRHLFRPLRIYLSRRFFSYAFAFSRALVLLIYLHGRLLICTYTLLSYPS